MNRISRFAVDHPAVVGILLISLLFFGLISIRSINTSLMPSLSMPEIVVLSVYPGADAQDIEHDVTKVIEDDMATLSGLKMIESKSGQSVSLITLSFQDGIDAEDKIEEVRYRLSRLRSELPDDLQGDPEALIASSSMVPCISFSVSNSDLDRTYEYLVDEIVPRITRIPGVTTVEVSPDASREISIVMRPDDMASRNISPIDIYKVLSSGSSDFPLGEFSYDGRGVSFKYDGSYKSIADLRNMAVGASDSGVVTRLGDVADIMADRAENPDDVLVGGKRAFMVSVQKRDDGDVIRICSAVKKVISEMERESSGALSISVFNDDSKVTGTTLKAVMSSGVLGILMAVLSIWLCLADFKATFIIAVSIPLCILFCVIALSVSGRSLNTMTLSGMVMSLGMVVDGSIVMLEQVYRHLASGRFSIRQSLYRASDEVSGSILGSVATSVVVFIPIILLPGIVGMVLSDVALTLVFSMLASLAVSILAVPFFIRLIKKEGEPIREHRLVNSVFAWIEKRYAFVLKWILGNRKKVVLASVGMLVSSLAFVPLLGFTFIPSVDQAGMYIDFEFPLAYSQQDTRSQALRIADYIKGIDGLDNYRMNVTKGQSILDFGGRNIVSCHVVLVPSGKRRARIQRMIPAIQGDLNSLFPDAKISIRNGGFDSYLAYAAGGGGYGMNLIGEDMRILYAEAERIRNVLNAHPDVMFTRLSTTWDSRSLSLDMIRSNMSDLAVTSLEAGLASALYFRKTEVGRFRESGKDSRYKLSLTSKLKDSPVTDDVLNRIRVRSVAGEMVPFDRISSLSESGTLTFIGRKNRARCISIESSLVSSDLSPVTAHMLNYLKKNPLPQGVERDRTGLIALISDSIPPLFLAALIAVFLVYAVMVMQFERFLQPMIVMVCIPFTFIGVIAGLLLFGTPVSIMSVLAMVALSGTVVNNGIILIDYTNMQRDRHRECRMRGIDSAVLAQSDCDISGKNYRDLSSDWKWELESLERLVIECCASRIRPIFMTAATTVLGVIPMAFGKGEGAELYAPLGQSMFLGLFVSTFLSLAIVPALYYSAEKRRILRMSRSM